MSQSGSPANTDDAGQRPLDTWRVCNQPVDYDTHHFGCTCGPWLEATTAIAAAKRLRGEL